MLHPMQRHDCRPPSLCHEYPLLVAFVKLQPFSEQTSASADTDIGWRGSAGPALPKRRARRVLQGRVTALCIRLTCTRVFIHVCVQGCACISAIFLVCMCKARTLM